jgi:hypothetical protein
MNKEEMTNLFGEKLTEDSKEILKPLMNRLALLHKASEGRLFSCHTMYDYLIDNFLPEQVKHNRKAYTSYIHRYVYPVIEEWGFEKSSRDGGSKQDWWRFPAYIIAEEDNQMELPLKVEVTSPEPSEETFEEFMSHFESGTTELSKYSTEQLRDELIKRGWKVNLK